MQKQTQNSFEEKIRETFFSEEAYEDTPLTEEKLVDILGASRTRVREGLKALEKEGIIEKRQKKGVYLRKPSLKEIAEIFDARSGIEGFAGRLAARVVKEKDLKKLEKIGKEQRQELESGNIDKADALDNIFHRKIIQISGNKTLLRITDSFHILEKAFKMCHAIQSIAVIEYNPHSHEEIIESLREKNPTEVENIIRYHVQWSKQWLIEQAMGIKINHFEEKRGG